MILRGAGVGDVLTVWQILFQSRETYLPFARSVHSEADNLRWVENMLIPQCEVTIATRAGVDVGVIATSVQQRVGWIDQLYVAPGYTAQGVGSRLLRHALAGLPRPVHLWTFQQNERALEFYKHFGFKAITYTDGSGNEEQCPDVLLELA
ncbi:MAG: GNAT family N-acetyltransferase [Pseudomonadota bacterium]